METMTDKRKPLKPISDAFALVPRRVIQSEAYKSLPDWAVRVLVALAGQYNGFNNGEIYLTSSNFRRLGVRAFWHVAAGCSLLATVGLIRRQRPTGNATLASCCFALTWLPIEREAQDGSNVSSPATDEWNEWECPSGWASHVRSVKLGAKERVT